MTDLRSQMLRIAAELPKGNPTRRELLAALKLARGDVRMTATWSESDYDNTGDSGGDLVSGAYQSIREAMDALLAATPQMERKEWEVTRKGLEGGIDLANGYVDYNATLTYKGKPFPKNALNKALLYLQTGREDMSPTVLGNVLSIPGNKGTITITPGNSKAWFEWTIARDGKPTSVSRGSTDDGVAEEAIRRGQDPTKVEEANGIDTVLRRETGLSKSQLYHIWRAVYRGSFRGLKMGSLKVALDHRATPVAPGIHGMNDRLTMEGWKAISSYPRSVGPADYMKVFGKQPVYIKMHGSKWEVVIPVKGEQYPLREEVKAVGKGSDGERAIRDLLSRSLRILHYQG